MVKLSALDLFATVVLAMFLLNSATIAAASVDGSLARNSDDEIATKMMRVMRQNDALKELQNEIMSSGLTRRCAEAGKYCNNYFGRPCCSGWISCVVPTNMFGGVCVS